MIRFTVVWSPTAEARLAQIWTAAPDLQAVTLAANDIDSQLAADPKSKGIHLHEGFYSLEIPPLRVLFSVSEADCLVEVASVKLMDRPAKEKRG